MITMKNKFLCLISMLLIFLSVISFASAIGISVTRAVINFNNVLKGGYAEDSFFVSTDAPFDVPISYELSGEMKDWVSIDPDLNAPNVTIFINNSHYQPIRVIVQPPADTPAGNYTGTLRVITGSLNKPGGQYGSQLQAAFLLRLTVEVTGTQYMSCSAGGIAIRDTEVGKPLEYYMTVSNGGNIRITPNASVDIWNQDQTKLVDTKYLSFDNLQVLPTTTQGFTTTFDENLRVGQYWGYVTVYPCQSTQLLTFNVYEPGTIVDTGDFIRIDNPPWAKVGDVVPFTAVFKNTGQRTVSAKVKGVITMDNKIIDTVDTDYYDIAPGETGSIKNYFTPKDPGQYVMTARILFNNKLSFEKSSALNVTGESAQNFNWLYILILIIIIIIVLLLLIRIKRKRQHIRRL